LFFATVILLNYPVLTHWSRFCRGLATELGVVNAHQIATPEWTYSKFLRFFFSGTTPAVWLFAAVHLICQWRNRSRISSVEWILTIFPWAMIIALGFSQKATDRYLLPAFA